MGVALRLLLVICILPACSLRKSDSKDPAEPSVDTSLFSGIWLSNSTDVNTKTPQLLVVKDKQWAFLYLNRNASQCDDSSFELRKSNLVFKSDGACPAALNRNVLSGEILQLDSKSLKIRFSQSETSKFEVQFERITTPRALSVVEERCISKNEVSSLFAFSTVKECSTQKIEAINRQDETENSANFKIEAKQPKLAYNRTADMDQLRGAKRLQVLRRIDMTRLSAQGVYFYAGSFSETIPNKKPYCKLKSYDPMIVPVGAVIAIRDASDAPEFGQGFFDFETSEPLNSLICYVEPGTKPSMANFEDSVGNYLQIIQ